MCGQPHRDATGVCLVGDQLRLHHGGHFFGQFIREGEAGLKVAVDGEEFLGAVGCSRADASSVFRWPWPANEVAPAKK
jgi:hypothetical protein